MESSLEAPVVSRQLLVDPTSAVAVKMEGLESRQALAVGALERDRWTQDRWWVTVILLLRWERKEDIKTSVRTC